MSGLSPKLPISLDENDGFKLTKTFKEMIQQNFKNLILTAPGERVMDINFGVGMRNYLFENNTGETFSKIKIKINEQVNKYMPFIEIQEITFKTSEMEEIETMDRNMMMLKITYKILPIDEEAVLEVTQKIS